MEQTNYFMVIPASVWANDNLAHFQKLLYGHITTLTNKNGYCFASNTHLAELNKVCSSTISKSIHMLEMEGLIKVEYSNDEKGTQRKISINPENNNVIQQENKKPEVPIKRNGFFNNIEKPKDKKEVFVNSIVEKWNTIFEDKDIPKVYKLSKNRIRGWWNIYETYPNKKLWDKFFELLKSNKTEELGKLTTTAGNRWFNFDFFLKDTARFEKFINGDYFVRKNSVGFNNNDVKINNLTKDRTICLN